MTKGYLSPKSNQRLHSQPRESLDAVKILTNDHSEFMLKLIIAYTIDI